MKLLILSISISVVVLLHIALLRTLLNIDDNIQSIKDCSLAEISPDFTIKEKELCRSKHGTK